MTEYSDNPIQSDKLTALFEDRDKLIALSAQSRATVWQLSQTPQSHQVTVRRIENEAQDNATRNGVISTGREQEEAARKADEIKRTLNGQPLADASSKEERLAKEMRQWQAYEDASEFRTREIEAERNVLRIKYATAQKPKYDALMARFCRPLLRATCCCSGVVYSGKAFN